MGDICKSFVCLNTATNWNAVPFQRLFKKRGSNMEKMAEEQRPAVNQSKSCCKRRCLIICVLCGSIILCLVFAGLIYWKFFSVPAPPKYGPPPPPPPPQQPPPSADDETGDCFQCEIEGKCEDWDCDDY